MSRSFLNSGILIVNHAVVSVSAVVLVLLLLKSLRKKTEKQWSVSYILFLIPVAILPQALTTPVGNANLRKDVNTSVNDTVGAL